MCQCSTGISNCLQKTEHLTNFFTKKNEIISLDAMFHQHSFSLIHAKNVIYAIFAFSLFQNFNNLCTLSMFILLKQVLRDAKFIEDIFLDLVLSFNFHGQKIKQCIFKVLIQPEIFFRYTQYGIVNSMILFCKHKN